jgi:hypothetical protein
LRRGRVRKCAEFDTAVSGPRTRVSVFGLLGQLMQAFSGVLAHGTELRVRAVTLCEVVAVFLSERTEEGIRSLLADLANLGRVSVSRAMVETSGEVMATIIRLGCREVLSIKTIVGGCSVTANRRWFAPGERHDKIARALHG